MTASRKPDGGVWGIVVGDFLRRLVACTLAPGILQGCFGGHSPVPVCLLDESRNKDHALQALASLDEDATVVSIDGVGAFDLISRNAMVSGLMDMSVIIFVEDDCGITHNIPQGEGGEQGDPLMPLLFSLGLHKSLTSVSDKLLTSERIFAFLDDIYLVCHPKWVEAVCEIVRQELRRHANIDHSGKTKICNRSGVSPTGIGRLTAQVHDPDAIVWRGNEGTFKLVACCCLSAPPPEQTSICGTWAPKLHVRSPFRTTRMCTTVCARSLGWILMTSARVLFNSQASHSTLEVWGSPVR